MKKIKILYFMDGIGNAGGIQEIVINWVKNFPKDKFQVDILSYDTGKRDNYAERFEAFGGKVYIIPTYTRKGSFFKSLKETKIFFDLHDDYQIIHAHASSKAYFVLREAKRHGIKYRILHSHVTQFVNRNIKSLFIGNLLKPFAIGVSTHYYACSHEAGNFLFGRRRMENQGLFIPNGIDIERFKRDKKIRELKRKELNISNNAIVIGNIGRFRPQKNHEFLIDVFSKICKLNTNAILILLGTGELFDKIKMQAENLNISDRIMFLGYRNDVNDIAQTFNVLVMPSLFEGLPVTCVEAQALGIPCVLASTITKDAKIIPNVEFISLNEDKERWAETILDYAKKGICDNSKNYLIEKNFDIKGSAKILENEYMKMVRGY